MRIKEKCKSLIDYIKANWHHMLYFPFTLNISRLILSVFKDKELVNAYIPFYTIASLVLLVIIKIFKNNKPVRYLLSFIHLASIIVLILYTDLGISEFTALAYMLILLYSYLFPDMFVPIIILGLFWYRASGYIGQADEQAVKNLFFGSVIQTCGYVACFAFFRGLHKEKERYKKQSNTDSLTGTYNLKYIMELGNQLLARKKHITIVVIDLNNFKQINDNFGHIQGNDILKDIAALLTGATGKYDGKIGRIGGDEFVILLTDENHYDVERFIKTIHSDLHAHGFVVDPDLEKIRLSFALGIARSCQAAKSDNLENLLHNADVQMLYNKYHNKNVPISSTPYFLPEQVLEYLNVLAEKDMYTYVHSEHVAKLGADLAREIGMPMEKVAEIYTAGWLHDIGKSLIPNRILRKSTGLAEDEYTLIQEHIEMGINIIRPLKIPEAVKKGIRFHHENWDGSGYPHSIKGESIPIEGRILKIIDAYSAMTIKRQYRKVCSKETALNEINRCKGAHFDPLLVEKFITMMNQDDQKKEADHVSGWIEKMQYKLSLSGSYDN